MDRNWHSSIFLSPFAIKESVDMKRTLSIVLVIAAACALAAPSKTSPVSFKTIDRHGRLIPSVFSGISPNPRIANARRIAERRENAYQFRARCRSRLKKASYHPRLQKVCGTSCAGHYYYQEYKPPEFCASCGGGDQLYAAHDPTIGDYCDGYYYDYNGCTQHCLQEIVQFCGNCIPTN